MRRLYITHRWCERCSEGEEDCDLQRVSVLAAAAAAAAAATGDECGGPELPNIPDRKCNDGADNSTTTRSQDCPMALLGPHCRCPPAERKLAFYALHI